jgi:hypothetical protein
MTEGLREGTRGNSKFFSISNGRLVERTTADDPKGVHRTKENGSVVHERYYAELTGRLKSIIVREHQEYGKFLKIEIIAEGKTHAIEFNFSSGYASSFLSTIPSANIEELITFCPSYKEKDGKKEARIFLKQEKGWLKSFFTKDNPNGLPELQKTKVKGKEVWDDSDRLEFYEAMILKLNAKLSEIHVTAATSKYTEAETANNVPFDNPFEQ